MLKITNLTVAYGQNIAVQDISLEVIPGEILALIGPNGAGKTTLVRAVSGLVSPQSGQITVDDQAIADIPSGERARMLSVVPQARHMGGAFTVEQAVMMGRTAHMGWLGRECQDDRDAVKLALEQTNLKDFAHRSISKLSGGEQQRVLLARALAQSTPVLMLDEPTNHLDLQHQTSLLSLVRQLAQEKQLTVMMALHDLNLVSFVADQVALIVNGLLQCVGTPPEVLSSENISQAYQIPVDIVSHPRTGSPIIFPQGIVKERD
ncbi:MAG: ABC transporter ATP-binding protein [Anaerolineales bacterium]|nr:ABC transporter ATP-binding protein [Chloroflexota bacterium]MBL6983767.1 ABC transporter ATP-binding protein [Anaerolineales bacterium]